MAPQRRGKKRTREEEEMEIKIRALWVEGVAPCSRALFEVGTTFSWDTAQFRQAKQNLHAAMARTHKQEYRIRDMAKTVPLRRCWYMMWKNVRERRATVKAETDTIVHVFVELPYDVMRLVVQFLPLVNKYIE